jgi:hypothetical protein
MRLPLKLAAFGIILLLPKTDAYLSKAYLSETQTTSEPAVAQDVNSTKGPTVFAEGKQAESSTCAAKPGHDTSDTAAIHACKVIAIGESGVTNAVAIAEIAYRQLGLPYKQSR